MSKVYLYLLLCTLCTASGEDIAAHRASFISGDYGSQHAEVSSGNSKNLLVGRQEIALVRRNKTKAATGRNVLMVEDDRIQKSGFACSLGKRRIDQYLNVATRTWIVDDKALRQLDNDLQAIVNCTKEGDSVLFDVSKTITPASLVIIPWRLTIGTHESDRDLDRGSSLKSSRKTKLTCPNSSNGVFLVKSKGLVISNIVFDSCSFNVTGRRIGIIETTGCESEKSIDVLRLLHVEFSNNRLIGGAGLLVNNPSCFSTELMDVEFKDNTFQRASGASLSSKNQLDKIVIDRNTYIGDEEDVSSILYAPRGSHTTVEGLVARKNVGTVIFIDGGSLALSNSSFTKNAANITVDVDPFGSCLHLVDSSAGIEDCQFLKNEADLGGVLHLNGSSVDIVDSRFEKNSAKNGAVFYATQRSRIEIEASLFSENVAEDDGGVVYSDNSDAVIRDSTITRNSADSRGGCFWFDNSSNATVTHCNLNKNRASSGGAFFVSQSTILIDESKCDENMAILGGCLYAEDKSVVEGGGMYNEPNTSLTIRQSNFTSNSVEDKGGVILLDASKLSLSASYFINNKGQQGGGILAENGSDITIADVHFEGNKGRDAAAAYFSRNKNVNVTACSFLNNEAKRWAGSMFIELSTTFIEDCSFRDGRSGYGGFILFLESDIKITNTNFLEGTASSVGGCLLINSESHLTMRNISLTSCEAELEGGAIDIANSTMIMHNCTLSKNKGLNGGGINSVRSKLSLDDVVVENGKASYSGGIYATDSSTLQLRNCRFSRNEAEFGGGLILDSKTVGEMKNCSFKENSVKEDGGGVYMDISSARITDCEFVNNSASSGGSLAISQKSKLVLSNSSCISNEATNAGCMMCEGRSYIEVQNVTMEENRALQEGGALFATVGCEMVFKSSTLKSNSAQENGGAILGDESVFEGDNLIIVNNTAAQKGGGVCFEESASFTLSRSILTDNAARLGGALFLSNVTRSAFRSLTMRKNFASSSGGCVYLQDSNGIFEGLQWSENEALNGGTLYVSHSSTNITNATCINSTSIEDGGAVYAIDNSTLGMKNVWIKRGIAGKGGGAVSLQSSHLIATNLTASYCRSAENGGVLLANTTSTLLCVDCLLKNSRAGGRGGAVSIESNEAQLLVGQFQRSVLSNNSARVGGAISVSTTTAFFLGGLHFFSPYRNADCSIKGANCTFLVLSDTQFERNKAFHSGGAIFAVDLKTIRVVCSKTAANDDEDAFYTRKQWESIKSIRSLDDICSSWKLNVADVYGNQVGGRASLAKTVVHDDNKAIDIRANPKPYVIENHVSGKPLPDIVLDIVDELGQGPAIDVNSRVVDATMSSSGFLTGSIVLPLKNGSNTFTGIVGFQVPGLYDVVIGFSEESLKEVRFKVKLRSCSVGETETSNRLFCQQCSATSYSFDPTGGAQCLPCPENANCTSITIRPNTGNWNRFPCSARVQPCLTRRACDYEGRDLEIERISIQAKNCSYNQKTIEEYEAALCRPGHKGPLCGSCRENHGKSHSFNCEECFTGFGNVVLILVAILVLVGLSGFTIRGNLVSFVKQLHKKNQPTTTGPSTISISVQANLSMIEKYYLSQEPDDGNRPKLEDVRARLARQADLAKWKAVELFKIAVNFVQVTAIAVAINVEWSGLLLALFEAAEFIGGITSEAANRSVDCLFSDDASISRSVIGIVVDLLVPAVVVCLFVIFWTAVSMKKGKGFVYLLKRSVLSTLAVLYISYISITKTLVNILSCIEVHDSTIAMEDHASYYWAVDTSLKCYEGSHAVLTGAAGWPLLFLFSLLFPVSIAAVIVFNIKGAYEEGWIYDVAGFLYRSYGHKYIFWESVIMLRKALLAVIVVFAYPLGGSLQAVLAIFILSLALYFQTLCRPFRKEFDGLNEMEGVSLLISLLVFVSSLCFGNERVPSIARLCITVVVFVLVVGLFFFFVGFFFVFSSKHFKAVLDKEGVQYKVDGGTLHILSVYFFVYLNRVVLDAFGRCFRFLIGPRFYDSKDGGN